SSPPDFAAMRAALAERVPQATLDDHRTWVDRLVAMARTTVTIGVSILVLMLTATVLAIVLATRGARSGNGPLLAGLQLRGPQATLDDHRTWVDRLVAMARTTVTIGVSILVLMLTATVLAIVFATRGAMSGNGHIIEVLHFVGAEARFIAGQFRRHFLLTGMK